MVFNFLFSYRKEHDDNGKRRSAFPQRENTPWNLWQNTTEEEKEIGRGSRARRVAGMHGCKKRGRFSLFKKKKEKRPLFTNFDLRILCAFLHSRIHATTQPCIPACQMDTFSDFHVSDVCLFYNLNDS